MTEEIVEVVLSRADQDRIIEGIRRSNGLTYKFDPDGAYTIARRVKEKAVDVVFGRTGKVPKLGVPGVSSANDGSIVARFLVTGYRA